MPGIIPACAGSTLCGTVRFARCRDHPRMCGEHPDSQDAQALVSGSSPHVRGALHCEDPSWTPDGIIPACAGSTSTTATCSTTSWDHPRMCGEHWLIADLQAPLRGSSPHVRGARDGLAFGCSVDGIIPACAGSTEGHMAQSDRARDHPRMCGEHSGSGGIGRVNGGSSPHVRGAPPSMQKR